MFKTITLEGLRTNPKMAGHEVDEEEHSGKHVCEHDANDIEHIKAHDVMAEAIKDCDYVLVKMACKNTTNSMKEFGFKVKKYNGEKTNAKRHLEKYLPNFKGSLYSQPLYLRCLPHQEPKLPASRLCYLR